MTEELLLDRRIAGRLSRTWDPFFARHGRLTPIQRAAIPEIVEGHSVLLSAPTAAGKTEAVCAPLLERMLSRRHEWRVIYVSPTRALVNDLFERLCGPMELLGVSLARRTGEHRAGAESAKVLLTTPESLDSMLCRGRTNTGHMLASVSGVILDEIHLLEGSPRGEQLRWLLARLRRLRRFARDQRWVRDDSVQTVALSATVPDLAAVKDRYLPGGMVIELGGGREIEEIDLIGDSQRSEDAVRAYLESTRSAEKLLVFCQSRKRVDSLTHELSANLNELGYTVRAHHGSLSQSERESAEDEVKRTRKIVLVATSTLEIGIDIGDIDLVVLDSPAQDVPSLLQRLGRGNRRSGKTRVLLCADSAAERLIHEAMMTAARLGRLGDAMSGEQFAVAIQQVFSFIFQGPRVSRERSTLERFISDCLPLQSAQELIDHLGTTGKLRLEADRVFLGEAATELAGRGEIHSNIETGSGATVINERTGDAMASGVVLRGGRTLGVGGIATEVRGVSPGQIHVRHAPGQTPDSQSYAYDSRRVITGPGQPSAVREHLGLTAEQWPLISGSHGVVAFHFGDARLAEIIRLLAELSAKSGEISVDPWTITFRDPIRELPLWLAEPDALGLGNRVVSDVDRLERRLGRPYANRELPLSWRIAELRSWLQVDAACARLRSTRLVPANDMSVIQLLQTLASH